jgi:pyridoxal phosphate enzyme (YggS family)
MTDIAAQLRRVTDQIGEAALRSGREPTSVRLLAAAKSQSVSSVREAIASGLRLIGENYVQEAQEKKRQIDTPGIEWHMIGHLQRNKVKIALDLFDVIETLDNIPLARELDKEGKKRGRAIMAFIEVNLAGEESKSGVAKSKLSILLDEIASLTHVHVSGLMTVPPFREKLEEVRPYFCELRELRTQISKRGIPNIAPEDLSMGMTHDFTVAIEEGATIVRIGTALFGPRTS